jgi:hypothetical protein
MSRQKDFFKKMHPEQFSDSYIVKVGKLDKALFDYYLSTITNKSKEIDFESFCRQIAQVELCPNLLPHTGPTGGGDSKVDSETYPVAEVIAETWFTGNPHRAAAERWAFAFSAKKDWLSKVKSDVEKIAKTIRDNKREYTTIFFITNQYVPDKKRADTEDALRLQYNTDIRILDKSWILDKTFSSKTNTMIAIAAFNLSELLIDEISVGANDYSRKKSVNCC